MALPKWLVPAGLVTLVVGGLAYVMKPSPKLNDVVIVHVGRVPLAPGVNLAALLGKAPPSAKIGLQLTKVDGDKLTGSVVGWEDSSGLTRGPGGAGVLPMDIDRSWVLDIYRGPVGQEKKI